MSGLRDMLFETLDKLQAGKMEPGHAKTVAHLAQTILNSAQVQMEFEKLRLESVIPGVLPSMPLVPQIKKVEAA